MERAPGFLSTLDKTSCLAYT